MAVNTSDYLLQQLVNQTKDNNDSLTAIRELLAENIKNDKKKSGSNSKKNGSSSSSSSNRGNRGSAQADDGKAFGKLFKSLSSEVSNVSKTMMNSSTNVSTVVNSLGVSASSFAGSLAMMPGPIGAAAAAFKLVTGAGLAVYNALNAQLEVYTRINSAGVALAEGYGSVLKGAGASMLSMDAFSEALQTHSSVVAQLDGAYGDGVATFGKLLGTVQQAQNELGLYGISQKTLTDLTARNIKFQKQYGGREALRSMDQAKSTEQFIMSMTKFSKSMGESVDALLNKTQNLDKSLDTRSMQIALQNYSGLSSKAAVATSKAFNEAAGAMGDAGADFLRLISHRLSIGGVPDDLLTPVLNQFADLGENLVRSGVTDSQEIRRQQLEFVKKNKELIKQDLLNQIQLGNTTAATFYQQLLDMEATVNEPKNNPADKLTQFTNRFNMWISKEFTEPFNTMYANTQNSIVDYLSDIADRTDGAWEFIGELALDGFGLVPIAKDAIAYLDRIGAEFTAWLDGLGADIFGSGYSKVSEAFDTFMNNLMDLPGNLWNSVKSWFGGGSDNDIKLNNSTETPAESVNNIIDNGVNSVSDYFAGMWDKFNKWNTSRNYKEPKPLPSDYADSLFNRPGVERIRPVIEKTNNVAPEITVSRKDFDKTAWAPGEPPVPPKPDDTEAIKKMINNGSAVTSRTGPPAPISDEMKEILKKLADVNEQSLSAVQQTNNYLRTISENTQGERNS
ncbi:hypothetical protein ACRYKS_22620 [Escherichia coli]|uniref:Pore-forming tail tip protein n=1 Tax=Escherichia phage fEgEco12 TaxID=3158837 RepID=A0AAU7PGY0_9CAUD|nr:hypothetical protein [Escherichia coli]ELW0836252.1 hypothetical protein [Escherichia coli]QAY00462.1 structural protein [Escherichia phage Ecwhy_1]WGM49573.1 tail length tape measure protein [Escherichia phage vB_Ec-M-J]VVY07224.1 Uncharacterised protein [Escherichia coli]